MNKLLKELLSLGSFSKFVPVVDNDGALIVGFYKEVLISYKANFAVHIIPVREWNQSELRGSQDNHNDPNNRLMKDLNKSFMNN